MPLTGQRCRLARQKYPQVSAVRVQVSASIRDCEETCVSDACETGNGNVWYGVYLEKFVSWNRIQIGTRNHWSRTVPREKDQPRRYETRPRTCVPRHASERTRACKTMRPCVRSSASGQIKLQIVSAKRLGVRYTGALATDVKSHNLPIFRTIHGFIQFNSPIRDKCINSCSYIKLNSLNQ